MEKGNVVVFPVAETPDDIVIDILRDVTEDEVRAARQMIFGILSRTKSEFAVVRASLGRTSPYDQPDLNVEFRRKGADNVQRFHTKLPSPGD